MTLKLSTQDIRLMATFEHVTGVPAHDCLVKDGSIYFFLYYHNMPAAIGKGGSVISKLRSIFGKRVRIIEWHDDLEGMLRAFIPQIKQINTDNGGVTIALSPQDRAEVSGKDIKVLREALKRHFKIKDLKICHHM